MSEKKKKGIERRDFLIGSAVTVAAASLPVSGIEADEIPGHRYIDQRRCVGCGECAPLCPVGAIEIDVKASICEYNCCECGVCVRSRVCPHDAIREGRLTWPRTLRETFSNPLAEHKETGVAGRGTEGIKTNDTVERYGPGYVGVFVELGRPVLGTRFTDVQRVVIEFLKRGCRVIEDNPVASLISDPEHGYLKPEILDERAISVLVEFIVPEAEVSKLVEIIDELDQRVDSVFNVSVALHARDDGSSPIDEILGAGIFRLPNGKVNIGMAEGIVEGKGG